MPLRLACPGSGCLVTGLAALVLSVCVPARADIHTPLESHRTASTRRVTGGVCRVPGSCASPKRRAARVVIISVDGLRGSVLPQMDLPWHQSLYANGAYSWTAKTIRQASTLPSHAAMLSGCDVTEHGLSWNRWKPKAGYIRVPTIFEEAGARGYSTAMFVGKHKLKHIARPGTVEVFERPGYRCSKVALEAAEHIVNHRPEITFVHFSDPDGAGHTYGWKSRNYYRAVRKTDECLGVILKALKRVGIDDSTLVIVSADHGGHNHSHSGSRLVDREIPWIAWGPGVRHGYEIHGDVSTLDTAATALDALGIAVPSAVAGRPVSEIYVGN